MTKPKVHFIGIGGIGTSALARWFLSHNYTVSGSDASSSEITSELRKQGIRVFIGHQAKNVPRGANLAIFSAAVPINNPERRQAVKLGIPTKSYSEAVADLVRQYKTLAITGAHGKSTTTALLSLVLIKAGFDPTVIVGTKLKEFGDSNFRNGKGDYLVLEADEYQKSFLNYSPFAAIILNIDAEHLDYYKNLSTIKNAFLKFIGNIQPNGILILNKDDKNLFSLKNKIQKISQKKKIKIIWYGITNFADRQNLLYLRKILKISGEPSNVHRDALLGEHNVSNALAVYALAKALGIKDRDIFSAIGSYRGAWRRMEYRGNLELRIKNNELRRKIRKNREKFIIPDSKFIIPVYDDYAHHPTEIKATLAGIAQKWPKTALICVFQPHQAKRLSLLFKDFVGAFNSANVLVLLPVYQVAGRDKLSHNVDSKKLAQAIQKRTNQLKTEKLKTIVYLPSPKKLPTVLSQIINASCFMLHASCIVVMMGAGDIYKYTNLLLSYDNKRANR